MLSKMCRSQAAASQRFGLGIDAVRVRGPSPAPVQVWEHVPRVAALSVDSWCSTSCGSGALHRYGAARPPGCAQRAAGGDVPAGLAAFGGVPLGRRARGGGQRRRGSGQRAVLCGAARPGVFEHGAGARRDVVGARRQRLRLARQLRRLPARHLPGRPAVGRRRRSQGGRDRRPPRPRAPHPVDDRLRPGARLAVARLLVQRSARAAAGVRRRAGGARSHRLRPRPRVARPRSDGTFWVSEEFGPFLIHVAADGRLLEPPVAVPGCARRRTRSSTSRTGRAPRRPRWRPAAASRGWRSVPTAARCTRCSKGPWPVTTRRTCGSTSSTSGRAPSPTPFLTLRLEMPSQTVNLASLLDCRGRPGLPGRGRAAAGPGGDRRAEGRERPSAPRDRARQPRRRRARAAPQEGVSARHGGGRGERRLRRARRCSSTCSRSPTRPVSAATATSSGCRSTPSSRSTWWTSGPCWSPRTTTSPAPAAARAAGAATAAARSPPTRRSSSSSASAPRSTSTAAPAGRCWGVEGCAVLSFRTRARRGPEPRVVSGGPSTRRPRGRLASKQLRSARLGSLWAQVDALKLFPSLVGPRGPGGAQDDTGTGSKKGTGSKRDTMITGTTQPTARPDPLVQAGKELMTMEPQNHRSRSRNPVRVGLAAIGCCPGGRRGVVLAQEEAPLPQLKGGIQTPPPPTGEAEGRVQAAPRSSSTPWWRRSPSTRTRSSRRRSWRPPTRSRSSSSSSGSRRTRA